MNFLRYEKIEYFLKKNKIFLFNFTQNFSEKISQKTLFQYLIQRNIILHKKSIAIVNRVCRKRTEKWDAFDF